MMNTPDRVISSIGINASPASATKYIERSLVDLDDLINKRRLELHELRLSNQKRLTGSGSKGLTSFTPSPPNNDYVKINSMNVAVSSVPSSSSRSSSSSSSNRYSNINLTQHNNQQYPSTVSPYNSGSFMKHDLDVEIIASSPSPSSREHELSLLLQQERSKLSQCQHQLKDAETQTNIYMQKYQNISHEKNQFELHKSQIEDDLQSSRDELLFLRNQLHIKSGKISELETMLQQNQTSACINANTATATTDYKKLYDDAINENYLWAAKMDESERCIVELEDEKRVINDALFQWEAAFAQLETKMGGMAQKEEGMNERIVSLEISAAKYRNRSQGYMYAHKISCKKRLLSRCFDALRLRCYYKKLYVMQQQSDDINVTTQQTKAHNHLTDMSAPVSLVESEVAVLPPTSSESSTDIIQSSDELLRQLSFRLEHNTPNQTIRDRKISSLILLAFFQLIVWIVLIIGGYIYLMERDVDLQLSQKLQELWIHLKNNKYQFRYFL